MSGDESGREWRKSSRSYGGGTCVEVASLGDLIAVRDSKNPDGMVLMYAEAKWNTFVYDMRNREFDLSRSCGPSWTQVCVKGIGEFRPDSAASSRSQKLET